jgi:hypothetical protein
MKIIVVVFGAFAAILIFAALAGIPVYFLWNWLCPQLFKLPQITFLEAVGLSALCGCLFKSSSTSSSKS